jgi:DNA-binding IclR family transcriptional regulator
VQNKPSYPLESVDHALTLLEALRERGEMRVTDAAAMLGVAKSTAHRVLAVLRFRGFAVQDRHRTYRPGPKLVAISAMPPVPDLVTVAHPYLRELRTLAGETVHLMVLEGNGARFLDGVEGSAALRVGSRNGMLLPAHTSSGGKALLAELPEPVFTSLYPRGIRTSDPAASAIALARLRRELAIIRRRGYAVNVDESERGVSAVGCCVRDNGGTALAAVAIATPSVRFTKTRRTELVALLRTAAQHIGEDL